MLVWLLYKRNFSELLPVDHGVLRLLEEAAAFNICVKVYRPNEFEVINTLMFGKDTLPDIVISRVGAESTYSLLILLRQFEMMGIRVCNSYSSICAVKDKLFLSQLLTLNHLPTPKTALLHFPIHEEYIQQTFNFPVVIKPISGARGFGVTLCQDIYQLKSWMELLFLQNKELKLMIQDFVASSSGVDLRVFVLGGKVIACMKRTATQGFKANYSLGGSVSAYHITDEIEQLALAAARCCGLEIAGVDLLFTEEGLTICEVNSSPGFKGMELATGKNIAKAIWEYVALK